MSKTVGKVLAVAAVVVGVVAAIPTGGASLGLSAAALSAITAGIAAASLLNAALMKTGAKTQLQARQASVVGLQLGEVAREAVVGEACTGGSLADAFNYGGQYGTDWECRVIALADHRCDGLTGFYVNDVYVPFTGDGAVAGYAGQLEVYFRPGTTDQTVPAVVLANGPGWTPSDIGYGVCWVAVCYKADKADAKNPVWPAGRPAFSWVVRGKRCYQARKDSSVGGSGPHRWSDPSTWEWTDNPIDCRYNWVRGIYAGDRIGEPGMLLVGRGLTPIEAPPANVFAPANVCDETVPLDAGGSEPRYRANGVIKADETYIDVEEHFAAACGGVILQPEGAVEIEPGQAKAPVFFFSDDDLLVGSSVDFTSDLPESSDAWVNTVLPRYIEPSLKYADHAAPVRRLIADVVADGGPREQSLSLSLVTSVTQAGRLGEIARRMGRLLSRARVTLGPVFAEVEEGDWGIWTSQRYLKGGSMLVRVEAYALDERWHNTLNLRGIATDVYARDADAGSTSVARQQPVPSAPQPGADAWSATGPETTRDDPLPFLLIEGATDSDYAELIRFEYASAENVNNPAEVAAWTEAGLAGPDARRFEISTVAPSTSYYIAISYLIGRVPGGRRILGPVATAAIDVVGQAGAAAIAAVLTNESHTVPADAAGAVTSYAGAAGAFRVLSGSTDVSSSFALSTIDNPQALAVSYSGQTYTVSGGLDANEDSAALTIRATGSGAFAGVTVDKVFSLGKSKAGANGAPAKLLTAISNSQTLTVTAAGALDPAGTVQNITFTAARQNTTAAVTWVARDQAGSVTNNFSGTSVTIAAADLLTIINNAGANARSMTMTATLTDGTTLTDTVSVAKVQAGAQGAQGIQGNTGAAGAPAVTGVLTNESHLVPASADGTVTSYAGASGSVVVFAGSANVSGSFTLSTVDNPQALTVSYSGQSFTVTGGLDANEESASLTIRATGSGAYAGVTLDKVFSLSKSRAGAGGANAKLLYATSSSQTLSYSAAGALDPAGTAQNVTFTAVKQNTTAAVTWSLRDQSGTVTNNYSGDTVTLTGDALFNAMANAGANARSITMTASLTDGTTLTDTISIAKVQAGAQGNQGIQGNTGAAAITALLTNENHTLPALTDGTVTSYSGAAGAMRIYAGAGDITSAFTLSSQANPQALTVSYNGQSYTVTGGLDPGEENATLTIRATGSGAYAGVTVDKVFTLAKSKTGTPGTNGNPGANAKLLYATSTSQTVTVSAAGALDPAGTAQNITFAAVKQNTAAAVSWSARNQAGTVTNNFSGDTVTIAATDLLTIINSAGANARSMTMTATLTDGTTLTDTISVAKVQAGAQGAQGVQGNQGNTGSTGAAAAAIALTASPTQVRYTSAGAIIATDVVLVAARQNTVAATYWILRNLAGASLFEGAAADFVSAGGGAWTSANNDQLTRTASTLSGLMDGGGGGFIMEARLAGTAISQRVTVSRIQDGPQGPSGVSAPQPKVVGGTGTALDPILLEPGRTLTISAEVGVQTSGANGNATLQIQASIGTGAFNVIGSDTQPVTTTEPVLLSASGSITNNATTRQFVNARVAVTGPSGFSIRTGTTNNIRAV